MAKYLDEKEYLVYVKGEEKDYEYTFTGKELKDRKCPLRYVEDAEGSLSVCGGHLKEIENGFQCEACGQHFIDTNKMGECEHKKTYFAEEIQQGHTIRGYRCQDCEEWINEDNYNFYDNQ